MNDRTKTITRRAALGTFAAAGAGYVAFGPKGSSSRREGKRVVLDYWEKWTGHEAAAMKEVVEAFNQSQNNIFVNYLTMSGIDQKAKISIAAGDPPDVLGIWNRNIPFFVQCGAIKPLTGLREYGIGPESYATAMRDIVFYGDVQTCAPLATSSMALYYNRAIFEEVGLDPDAPPTTIEEFDVAIGELTTLDSKKNVVRAGFLPGDPGWWSWCWGYFFGGHLYDARTGKATVNSPQNIAGYDWFQSFPKRWGLERMRAFQGAIVDNPSPYRNFFSGRLATTIQGPWLPMFMDQELGKGVFQYGACPFPVPAALYDPAAPYGPIEADVLVIPEGSRNPDAALEFVAHTQRQDMMELLSSAHAKPSPLAKSSAAFKRDHPNLAINTHEAILQSPNAFTIPKIPGWEEFGDALGSGLDTIGNLKSPSAKEPLDKVQIRVTEILDRAAQRRKRRDQPNPWEMT